MLGLKQDVMYYMVLLCQAVQAKAGSKIPKGVCILHSLSNLTHGGISLLPGLGIPTAIAPLAGQWQKQVGFLTALFSFAYQLQAEGTLSCWDTHSA